MSKENTEQKVSVADNTNAEDTTSAETETTESVEVEGNTDADKRIPYDRFKAKVDEANALKAKLSEFETAQAEAERARLEEQNEYKTLYEQALQDAQQAKGEALSIKKSALLTQAGYDESQAKLLVKLVDGDGEESIAESIKVLRTSISPNGEYGDPGAFNGAKQKPTVIDNEEVGRNAINKVLHKLNL